MTGIAELETSRATAALPRARRTLRIAVAGCGAVGSAFLRTLDARRGALAGRLALDVEIVRVLVRDVDKPRDARTSRDRFTADLDAFLAADCDCVVEAIGGLAPARRIAEHALRRGRTLVTANKELVADCGARLARIARVHGGALRFDAAVGGGVPVLRLLDDALGEDAPRAVRGILNGTTNFVLSNLERGASLEDALAAARAAGFAEADATRDLDGRDAAAKIALVAWSAFGLAPDRVAVRRTSLLPDPARFTALAARAGLAARQIAECALVDGALLASVEPVFVDARSAFARACDEQNHVEVDTGWSTPLAASGPGAGGLPTATALLSDVVAPARDRRCTALAAPTLADARRSDWVLEILGDPQLLHRLLPRCGIVHTDGDARAAWTLVRAATPDEIAQSVRALEAAHAQPIAARVDAGASAGLLS